MNTLTDTFSKQDGSTLDLKIKIIGVGGAGTNAVDGIKLDDLGDVRLAAINTDVQALNQSPLAEKLVIGRSITRGLGSGGELEIGKKADLVLHDTDRPEWRPLLNVMNQLVWSADGRGVHTVLVDGQTVVEDGRCLTVDEEKLWSDVQQMGEAITGRSGLPDKAKFPTL